MQQALERNVRSRHGMPREMTKAPTRKSESTDVHVCGGLPRSSVEVLVMRMERRR